MTKTSERAADRLSMARFLLDQEDANSADAVAYCHAVLAQIGLPRSPQKTRVWERVNGDAAMAILAGGLYDHRRKERVEQPLPQGPYARLILADISTFAIKHRSRSIPMESSAGAYMRNRLHLFPGGGKRGTYTSFKREAQALAAAHVELSVVYGSRFKNTAGRAIQEFQAWLVDDGGQQALWPCDLVLSESFYESLKAHAAPIDMRAYRALSHSALAQDIYTWLSHRLHRLRSPLDLPWSVLAEQFGGYADVKDFRRKFLERLKEVRSVYPDARVEVQRGRRGASGGALRLRRSPAPVPRIATVVPGSLGAEVALGGSIDPKVRRLATPRIG